MTLALAFFGFVVVVVALTLAGPLWERHRDRQERERGLKRMCDSWLQDIEAWLNGGEDPWRP